MKELSMDEIGYFLFMESKERERKELASWRNWEEGDTIKYHWNDFDGKGYNTGVLIEKGIDHSIVLVDGMKLWLDDDTEENFKKVY